MIVTIGNTKGGVGKTTLALNIAIARARTGQDVWLIDGDRQATASNALAIRAESGQEPTIATAQYFDGQTLRVQVSLQAKKYQDVVIDVGGRDSSALRAALGLSDVLVIPFQPRSIDVWALRDIAELVADIRGFGKELKVCAVLNLADIQGQDNKDAAEALADFPGIELLDTPIRRRKAFANAAGEGKSVLEYEPVDAKARAELNALVNAIFN
ncbi:AAA family ATPase [Propionivibrio sp.]|uniref:nucleotide-binding protein n=1 Tax=Propionivibrio sp. TaxID=2212460 RepID=UPI003BF2B6F5